MKSMMLVVFAAFACVAFAKCPDGSKGGSRKGPARGPRAAECGMMPRGGGEKGGMFGDPAVKAAMNPRIAEKIGLSDETQLKLKKIDIDSRKAIRELQQKAKAAMEKQASLLKEAKIDEPAVMAVIDELFDLRKQMAKSQTSRLIAVKSLLTPEQLEKALAEVREFRGERRGRRAKDGQKDCPKNCPDKGESAPEE